MRRGRKPISNEPATMIGIYIPIPTRAILVKLANSRGISLSAAARIAVDRGLRALVEDVDKELISEMVRNRAAARTTSPAALEEAIPAPEAPNVQ